MKKILLLIMLAITCVLCADKKVDKNIDITTEAK